MYVVYIEGVSTSSVTYCVVINVQIVIFRVVERAQPKTTLRTNVSNDEFQRSTVVYTCQPWSLRALRVLFMNPQACMES